MNRLQLLLVGVAGAAVSGCTMIPKYQRPQAPVPTTLPTGAAYRAGATTAPAAAELSWQEFIQDPRLRTLVSVALTNNRDLRIAVLNVERARGYYGIQRATLAPSVNANASGNRQHVPGDLSSSGRHTTSEQYNVNLGVAAWEVDFFGRLRSLKDASLQEFLATEQARHSAQILLVSGVANTYLALAADRENLKLAMTTLQTQRNSYDLVKRSFDLGLVPELDVHRAQTQVDAASGDVARFTQIVAQDENALRLLVGGDVPDELLPDDLTQVVPPREIAAGVSSEVLLQRPDILQAEYRLKAANANIGAARAAFFPRVSLTAAAGTASSDLSGLFKSGSGAWNYGPQITMPIFDARVWAAARVAKTEQALAVAQYERAIQVSFREVADALAVRGTVDQQVASQESLVRAVGETYRLSDIRYTKGIDSYLGVLDAQRSLYAAQQGLVSLRLAQVSSQVRLYAVLGGGWQAPLDDAAATTQPGTR